MTSGQNKVRALFLSDLHLGSPHCKSKRLLDFLSAIEADRIYLIGDVFDRPKSLLANLPHEHRLILRELAKKASADTIIIYIPGNHDALFRNYTGHYGNLMIAHRYLHTGKHGARFLITHGDETDMWSLGWVLNIVIYLEKFVPLTLWEICRHFLGKSIARHTKKFEQKMRKEAVKFSGVICGHVHFPCITEGYLNCGDWVHHCSAIVEHYNGEFELLKG